MFILRNTSPLKSRSKCRFIVYSKKQTKKNIFTYLYYMFYVAHFSSWMFVIFILKTYHKKKTKNPIFFVKKSGRTLLNYSNIVFLCLLIVNQHTEFSKQFMKKFSYTTWVELCNIKIKKKKNSLHFTTHFGAISVDL